MISSFKSYIQPKRVALYLNTLDEKAARFSTGDTVCIGDALTIDSKGWPYSTVSGHVVHIEEMLTPENGRSLAMIIENDYKNTLTRSLKRSDVPALIRDYFRTIFPLENYPFASNEPLLINLIHCNEPFVSIDPKYIEDDLEKVHQVLTVLHEHWPIQRVIVLITEDIKTKYFPEINIPIIWQTVDPSKRVDYLPRAINSFFNNALVYQKPYQYLSYESMINLNEMITQKRPNSLTRVVVSGNAITQSAVMDVRIGASMNDIKRVYQGYTTQENLTLYVNQLLDNRTLSHDDFAITNGIVGLNFQEHVELERYDCIACGRCNKHCPVGILPSKIMHSMADGIALAHMKSILCIECGLCSYYCPSKISVMTFVKQAKALLARNSS